MAKVVAEQQSTELEAASIVASKALQALATGESFNPAPDNEAPKGDAPENDSPANTGKVMTFGGLTITKRAAIAVDTGATIERATELPFKAIYTDFFKDIMTAIAADDKEGQLQTAFIPLSFIAENAKAYWAKQGKPQPKPTSLQDLKTKLSEHFKKWQGDDKTRLTIKLSTAFRDGTEALSQTRPDPDATEKGVRFWMQPS